MKRLGDAIAEMTRCGASSAPTLTAPTVYAPTSWNARLRARNSMYSPASTGN